MTFLKEDVRLPGEEKKRLPRPYYAGIGVSSEQELLEFLCAFGNAKNDVF
jgi:hypothetical protein